MSIEKLSECENTSKYGTCSECGISDHNLKMWHDIYAEEKEEWKVINNEEIQTQ